MAEAALVALAFMVILTIIGGFSYHVVQESVREIKRRERVTAMGKLLFDYHLAEDKEKFLAEYDWKGKEEVRYHFMKWLERQGNNG